MPYSFIKTRQDAVAYFYKTQVRPYLPQLEEGVNWADLPVEERRKVERQYLRQTPKCNQTPSVPCECVTTCRDDETPAEHRERAAAQTTIF